ncbi:DNA-directed RNA polymerase subunit beta' [Mycoplasmopsis gallopavonis]|uniref:DNA-directed RNA polymerase subunit beta' n=1 Tax=Mycoplasmopsis gallopavonis TaxID=76629 RepID=A0A449AYX2_9BACT|nr:DNA-directed RNA polymerase subunit beta' [Mycoplasmopsis gallopavonis]RIV16867.1 DNA-directed RNA polymerase subunit beta' [Mycoplasmopsis gallopavonis]VEU72675.1 DNA-directed RNA polymerase subunit beta' [Mycoplasmopsis gallopavonis]
MNNFDKEQENIQKLINKITLSLATDDDILEWSKGEVKKPETINYKSYKPEKDGLFDELIFGPTTDYKCPVCGTKYKKSDENSQCRKTQACEKYEPEILPKITRRSRMGHIKLHNPVVHFWFFKIDHSIISKLLGLRVHDSSKQVTKADLEKLIYYKSHIVLDSGELTSLKKNTIIDINDAATIYQDALVEMLGNYEVGSEEYEDIQAALEELREYAVSKIGKDFGIDFYQYNDIIHEYSSAKIGTGSQAIAYLLENINLEEEAKLVQQEIDAINEQGADEGLTSTKQQERQKLYKRLTVINSFIKSGQKPTSMLIYNLPVIPADLRPLVQLDGGRHSTSDVNELYRRIIIRNNRLEKWNESDAPMLIKQNEYRMIQEAVDALIDNARKKPSPVTSKDAHPLKSISDALTGKKGRFRQNLLGKRVDYSGRSVIVVGPTLRMHEVGIPRDMAAKLFEPWIIRELIRGEEGITSVKSAKKLIENLNPIIWPYVEKAIDGRPVLLNRAPTLHRLSIQAFQPVLIRGKAIKLHPLVTTAFNADFDGDQMAVHVPISDQAVREAKELMLASKNILGPKDGEPIINPSQDMILGLYYLTIEKANAKGEGNYYASYDDMLLAYEQGYITLHTRVVLPINALEKTSISEKTKEPYLISTVGKFILNNAFPTDFPFIFGKYVVTTYKTDENGNQKTIEKESIHTSEEDLERYTLPYGANFKAEIANMQVNLALTKKDIAKIVRKVYEKYVAVVNMEDVASVINTVTRIDYEDKFEECSKLIDYKGDEISKEHAKLISDFISETFEEISFNNHYKAEKLRWDLSQYTLALNQVWFKYTNFVASILDKIKNLGFQYSTISGTTISMNDITTLETTKEKIKKGEDYIEELKKYFEKGFLTDDERYNLVIQKWTEIKDSIEKDLKEVTKSDLDNPLFMMFTSGARGNSSNFTQLAGMRGLMQNNTKVLKADAENDRVVRSTVEIPVKSSFLDGLSAYEFYSSTHGARKGLTDTALNTAKLGYLTRRLVDVAQGIVVREEDCGSDFGFVVKDIKDTKTDTVIESLVERIEGRFTNSAILDDNGNVIVEGNTFITPELANLIVNKHGKKSVEIRSVLSCHTKNGVCKRCYGKDLASNRIVNIGEAVGVVAAQSIGEPGTQLTMRTFHTGGVAGVEDITGGFGRLIELIDAYDFPWGRPAVISKVYGEVVSITPAKDKSGRDTDVLIVGIQTRIDATRTEVIYENGKVSQKLRIKVGDKVYPGQKIFEGPIILNELLSYADTRAVQNYLLKEVQRLYRLQGITISDKYIEIIIRQMLSKIMITDPGDSNFFTGSLVDTFVYQRENGKLLAQGKKPAFGEVKIRGAKQTPLLSDSFLAAASYQETAKILVNSSIAKRVDYLEGLKENIILGLKIPTGTNSNYELKGKYDIRDPRSYFTANMLTDHLGDLEESDIIDLESLHDDEFYQNDSNHFDLDDFSYEAIDDFE